MALLIPEDIIETIRNTADIFEVVSESVQLKKTGHNFMGLCPFHSEKTPSFSVNPDRGIFHCFGCGVGGNVFSFVMKRDGITFPEAARILAGKYGISIPDKEMSPSSRKLSSERESLYAVNKMAMDFFSGQLFDSGTGGIARDYLTNRGIGGKTASDFKLGYAPEGWDNLARYLASRNVSHSIAEKSGLLATKNQERYYDRFRNRIIFPILDLSQQVIGFGGRVLDQSLPKYLNSPETPIYNKSKSLYGLNLTKQAIRATGTVHIVEGYFDLISLYMNGVENVAATLGTAITRDHVRMLSRSGVKKFILVFDSDEAGVKAAERSIPVFQKEFISSHVLVLPKPHDPDTFVREFGPDQFKKMSDGSLGIIPFLSEISIKKHGLSVEGRLSVIHDMTGPLSLVDDPIARSLYIRGLSGRIGVDEKAILEKVNGHGGARDIHSQLDSGSDNLSGHHVQRKVRAETRSLSYPVMERQIVSMMLQYPDIIEECRMVRVGEYFENRELKDLCVKILNYVGNHSDMASYFMIHADREEERRLIASLAIGDIPYLYKNCVNLIQQFINIRKKTDNSLSLRIRDAEERNDQELLLKLIQEKNAYSKTLKNQIHIRKR